MSRAKEAEKIKLRKMERALEEEKTELEKMKSLLDSIKGEEREKLLEKIERKKIDIILLKNKIARQKIKIRKMS